MPAHLITHIVLLESCSTLCTACSEKSNPIALCLSSRIGRYTSCLIILFFSQLKRSSFWRALPYNQHLTRSAAITLSMISAKNPVSCLKTLFGTFCQLAARSLYCHGLGCFCPEAIIGGDSAGIGGWRLRVLHVWAVAWRASGEGMDQGILSRAIQGGIAFLRERADATGTAFHDEASWCVSHPVHLFLSGCILCSPEHVPLECHSKNFCARGNSAVQVQCFLDFSVKSLIVQGPNSPFCPFVVDVGRVSIPPEEVTSTTDCVQDYVRGPHFTQRSFFSALGITMLPTRLAFWSVRESLQSSQLQDFGWFETLSRTFSWSAQECKKHKWAGVWCGKSSFLDFRRTRKSSMRISIIVKVGDAQFRSDEPRALGLSGSKRCTHGTCEGRERKN